MSLAEYDYTAFSNTWPRQFGQLFLTNSKLTEMHIVRPLYQTRVLFFFQNILYYISASPPILLFTKIILQKDKWHYNGQYCHTVGQVNLLQALILLMCQGYKWAGRFYLDGQLFSPMSYIWTAMGKWCTPLSCHSGLSLPFNGQLNDSIMMCFYYSNFSCNWYNTRGPFE